MTTTYRRPGTCQHLSISDDSLAAREAVIAATWGDMEPLDCPDCHEYLYPHDDGETVTVYAGEPLGAGNDPAGRPDPATHPEYWSE